MARFTNTDTTPKSVLSTVGKMGDVVTHEGAPAMALDPETELFTLATTNFVATNTFYEDAAARDSRYSALVRQLATSNPDFIRALIPWL